MIPIITQLLKKLSKLLGTTIDSSSPKISPKLISRKIQIWRKFFTWCESHHVIFHFVVVPFEANEHCHDVMDDNDEKSQLDVILDPGFKIRPGWVIEAHADTLQNETFNTLKYFQIYFAC